MLICFSLHQSQRALGRQSDTQTGFSSFRSEFWLQRFWFRFFLIFARLVADKDYDGIRNYFNKGVGVLFFAAIPIIIGILVVGLDSVRLVFERGAFDSEATFMVTEALWFLSVSILPYVFRDSITRVYYSFNDSATPFFVAFSSIVLKFLLNILLITKLEWELAELHFQRHL